MHRSWLAHGCACMCTPVACLLLAVEWDGGVTSAVSKLAGIAGLQPNL
jgi:hypothetical protein